MSREANAAGIVANDAFWHDATPVRLAADGPHPIPAADVPGHHVLFATSGTGGAPKWIALSKSALLASACAVNAHLLVTPGSVWGLALPIHHVGGFGVVARARIAGCALEVFQGAWNPGAWAAWAASRRVTHVSLVPTQAHDLVAAKCQAPAELLAVVVGGGRLGAVAGQAARDLGWPVLASYGMTEAASQIATQPLAALDQPYTPAPIPVLAHWQVRDDAAGCLEIAGPALFSGTITGGAYQPRGGRWHPTRDRVSITPEGLIPQGRADALVKIAGELVDPQEIEFRLATALATHGGGITILAVPDPRLGHQLAVVAESSVPEAILKPAIAAYNASVPRSQRLGTALRIDRIPRGPLGKISMARLLEITGLAP